jgi:UPF0755 protein
LRHRLLLVAGVLLVLLVAAGVELHRRWQQPLAVGETGLVFEVRSGDTLRSIARRLAEEGALAEPGLLIVYGRLTAQDQALRRGEYRIMPGTSAAGLLRLLQSDAVVQYAVTLPEGLTLRQALALLAEHPVLLHSLDGITDPRIAALTADYPAPEGLFLPETYRFVRGDSDWGILQRAYAAMQRTLRDAWELRDQPLPLETPYEALILASIIERETGVPAEREEIAGVFVRRLQRGMRLQTDPTVIYGLGPEFDGNLRRDHLRDASNRFNTYRHDGLPPTPIALPGAAAISAALHPAPGETLYFVARGDGSHEFSSTLEAHERAVRKYQLQRRQDYRSRPGNP